jgi:hypothetical protein
MLGLSATDQECGHRPSHAWTMLIYTVPAQPTRKRAAVWREVKRLGAVYLRDGVCVLPDVESARAGLEALSQRVAELGGQSTVVGQAQLSAATTEALLTEFAQARQAEYTEIGAAAADLLHHLQREALHHGFDRAELVGLHADLTRLERWLSQIVARDYLHHGDPAAVAATLEACRAEQETHTSASPQLRGPGEH